VKNRSARILPVIIFSQFAGTSLWFAGNAVLGDLQRQWELGDAALSYITSAVQLGFIIGTLLFAFFTISDRFSPRIVFFLCSLLGALANLGVYFAADGLISLLVLRFGTGFFLAGIYPVGIFLGFLILWGIVVVGDSPQFSTLTAQTAPKEFVGSALTIVTSIGFFITILSIQLTNFVINYISPDYIFLFLVPGPIFGLVNLWPLCRKYSRTRSEIL
jgi:hypothetical protein